MNMYDKIKEALAERMQHMTDEMEELLARLREGWTTQEEYMRLTSIHMRMYECKQLLRMVERIEAEHPMPETEFTKRDYFVPTCNLQKVHDRQHVLAVKKRDATGKEFDDLANEMAGLRDCLTQLGLPNAAQ